MSFTTGPLLHYESMIIAALFAEMQNWDAVRNIVIAENRLQMRTLNSSKRIYSEIVSRLKSLTAIQLERLQDIPPAEQAYLLWLAVCKRYRFIYDFSVEVLHEKFLRLDLALTYDDYDIFFNRKAEWHPEVERVAPATRRKQRQFVFRMLREAGVLTAVNTLTPIILSPQLANAIAQDDPAHFAIFPVSDLDISQWTDP
ncbi:MAG: DUF1819 family protein [Anaerolineales bacterium]|nr:DUF1819 family protein [Anaerolineales bacterium]